MSEPVIERPPPTVRDETLLAPAALAAPSPAPSPASPPAPTSRARAVAIALSLLAALLLVASVAFYLFVWRYEPVAHKHIPGNANLVMRLEFADVALFGPVRQHFWPLLFEQKDEKARADAAKMKQATGVDLATDLRELFVASVDGSGWVLIAGGRIKRGHFVAGLAKIAKDDAWPGWREDGEIVVGPGGVAVGQADDGTLIFATDASLVRAALPAADDYKRLGLPGKGGATFAVTHEAWEGVAGVAVVAHASVLRKIERATGELHLSASPELTMTIEPATGTLAPALAGEIEQLLAEMRIVALLLPDRAGEKGALQAARVSAKGDRVTITAPWSYGALDKACADLAERVRPAPH